MKHVEGQKWLLPLIPPFRMLSVPSTKRRRQIPISWETCSAEWRWV